MSARAKEGERVKLFVVDSDIIASATEKDDERAIICRGLLRKLLATLHEVLLTPSIKKEWEARYPGYAQAWAVQMSRRGLLKEEPEDPASGLAAEIEALEVSADVAAIMLKDCHLLEAALIGGKAIFSQDDSAYTHFYDASVYIERLQSIMWANPERAEDACEAWLQPGARREPGRCIGQRPKRRKS